MAEETGLEKVGAPLPLAGILPSVEGIKDMFLRYREFQKQLREILGEQDFIYLLKKGDGSQPETFLSRAEADRIAAIYRKGGQDCVVAEEILKSGLYRLRMLFGIYLLPEGERKVKDELVTTKSVAGGETQVLRRTEDCDAYRRVTIFTESTGINVYSCEIQLFGQMKQFRIYGSGSCNRAERGRDKVNSHTIISTAWTRAMKRLVEDATGVPMAFDAGEIGEETVSASADILKEVKVKPATEVKVQKFTPEPMPAVKPSESKPVAEKVKVQKYTPPTEPTPAAESPKPERKVEVEDDINWSALEPDKRIEIMRGFVQSIIRKKNLKRTAAQIETTLCAKVDKEFTHFGQLTNEQLIAVYKEGILPKL